MKRLLNFLAIFSLGAMICISCTKEGPQGAPGEDGIDGTDGTAGCIQCHTNNENMRIKSTEWAVSGHVTGGHMGGSTYASRDGCTDCHSSQGYQLAVMGSWDNTPADKPLSANCYTCHQIHETYTSDDWAFRTPDGGMPFLTNGETSDQGSSNTCIVCHQSRVAEPILDLASSDNVSITSSRYGPHHGPQGNMIAGMGLSGAYELSGTMNYVNSTHATDASCITCHMASGAGSGGNYELGGHSNNVAVGSWDDDSREVNVNGCIACHSEFTDNDGITAFVAGARATNLGLIDDLQQELIALGYVDEDGDVVASGGSPLVVSQAHAAAIYNFKFITEDKSILIHNPKYAKALIQNSIEALQ
ncbi:MAG: hypothetical protein KDC58_12270 [Cyclobacteriaceae bacterium]|nr:hypothetical protein [Cyclobacteriaceae bacterium]